jgi:transcriptional regulator with XRE-family HTH domain
MKFFVTIAGGSKENTMHPLKKWRVSRGLTLEMMADAINQATGDKMCSPSHIHIWEAGKVMPGREYCRAIETVTSSVVDFADLYRAVQS